MVAPDKVAAVVATSAAINTKECGFAVLANLPLVDYLSGRPQSSLNLYLTNQFERVCGPLVLFRIPNSVY